MFNNPCLFLEFKRLSNLNVFYPEMFSQFEKAVMTSTAKAEIIVKAKFGDLKKLKLESFVYIRVCFIPLRAEQVSKANLHSEQGGINFTPFVLSLPYTKKKI